MNIDILKQSYKTELQLELISAFYLQVQICEPKRNTPSSATCIDQILARKYIVTKTITTTMIDYFAIQGVFTSNTNKLDFKEESI